MKQKKTCNKAFTLTELLAVIVILAFIALITVPIILNIIEKTKKSAFKNSTYGIMKSAENFYTEQILDNEEITGQNFSFEPTTNNPLSYSGEKPKGGFISIRKNGKIALAFHNEKWCALKNINDTKIQIIKYETGNCILEEAKIAVKSNTPVNIISNTNREVLEYFNVPNAPVKCINKTDGKTITNTNSLALGTHIIQCSVLEEGEITSQAEKTVTVEAEIKIEDVIEKNDVGENGTVADDEGGNKRLTGLDPNNYVKFNNELWRVVGIFNGQLKIIRSENIGAMAWDTKGSNNWATSSLQQYLNQTYLNTIDETSKSYIDTNYTWHLGGATTAQITRVKMYELERSENAYSGHPNTWQGAIALMYPSDYAYATDSTQDTCDSTLIWNWEANCKVNNWLLDSTKDQWTLTPDNADPLYAYTIKTSGAIRLDTNGNDVKLEYLVRPTLYLKPNVRITNADLDQAGTKEKPFLLSTT